jgi:hypothetical protein
MRTRKQELAQRILRAIEDGFSPSHNDVMQFRALCDPKDVEDMDLEDLARREASPRRTEGH